MALRLFIVLLLCTRLASAQTTIVHFDFNSFTLNDETRSALDQVISSKETRALGIFGHTDQMGSDDYNDWLSYQRARAVRNYLVSRGLASEKISMVRGYGAQRLISDQQDSVSRQLNRRVVLMNGYRPLSTDSAIAARQATLQFKPGEIPKPGQSGSATGNPTASNANTNQSTGAGTSGTALNGSPVGSAATPTRPAGPPPVVKQQQNEKLIEDIKSKDVKAGENIVLKNINFLPGSHSFLESAYSPLEDLLETLEKVPTLEVEIQGHVCCQEGETDALDNATGELSLSVNRAKAVYDFLVEKGINKKRLSYKGLAHQFPLIANEVTEADRIVNRRVEIKILKK